MGSDDDNFFSPHTFFQDSVTLSNRQRYYIRRRGDVPAAIYLVMKKELLKNEQLYSRHVKKLISEGERMRLLDIV